MFVTVSIGLAECNPGGCGVPEETGQKIQAKIAAVPEYAAWVQAMKAELQPWLDRRPAHPL